MGRSFISIVCVLAGVSVGQRLCAQETPAPPDWQDRGSVYSTMKEQAAADSQQSGSTITHGPADQTASQPLLTPAELPPARETEIVPAVHEVPSNAPAETPSRRLAPPTKSRIPSSGSQSRGRPRLIEFGLPTQSIYTIGTSLTIVIGTFLLFVWVMRRGARRPAAALPEDVVSVLGRVPLAARQYAELLRVGNKLLLVSLTAHGAETLTEVTDQAEVDRLVGLCRQQDPHSTTKAFEHVFRQLSNEPTRGGFLGSDGLPTHLSPFAGAHRAERGERARA
jgi:flagellar biogenesis protein FliO